MANPRQIPLIYQNTKKSDQTDPEILARVGRLDPKLLKPIQHRDATSQASLAVLRARDSLVSARSKLINHVRGAVKSLGARVVSCSADSFHDKALESIPKELHGALSTVVKMIGELPKQVRRYDQRIEKELCKKKYPQTEVLREVPGVGPLTSLAFLLPQTIQGFPRRGRLSGADTKKAELTGRAAARARSRISRWAIDVAQRRNEPSPSHLKRSIDLIGAQQRLLHHVFDLVPRSKPLAQAGPHECGQTRAACAGQPIERGAIARLRLLDKVLLDVQWLHDRSHCQFPGERQESENGREISANRSTRRFIVLNGGRTAPV